MIDRAGHARRNAVDLNPGGANGSPYGAD